MSSERTPFSCRSRVCIVSTAPLKVAARVVGQAFSLRGAFSPAERAGETG
jgi:hypothetical protein